jgi:hypothetical protein
MELKAELTTKNIRKSRFSPEVVFATNEDGADIAKLVKSNGFNISADWSEVPNWLVAKLNNEVIGCLQVLPGKPFGRVEMLATHTGYKNVKRAQIAWRLVVAAMAILKMNGTQYASMMILFENKHFKRLVKKRGAWTIGQGNIMIARI